MNPTWLTIIELAFVNVLVFVAILKIFFAYDAEMESRNGEWE